MLFKILLNEITLGIPAVIDAIARNRRLQREQEAADRRRDAAAKKNKKETL